VLSNYFSKTKGGTKKYIKKKLAYINKNIFKEKK